MSKRGTGLRKGRGSAEAVELAALDELERAERAEVDTRARTRREAVERYVEGVDLQRQAAELSTRGEQLRDQAVADLRDGGLGPKQIEQLLGLPARAQSESLRRVTVHAQRTLNEPGDASVHGEDARPPAAEQARAEGDGGPGDLARTG